MLDRIVYFVKTATLIPSELTGDEINKIYAAGVNHGLFSDSNYGIADKRNSVCALIGTLRDLVKETPKKLPTRDEFLNSTGDFTSFFGSLFVIHTIHGVFEWDNPDFYGTGEITYVCETFSEYRKLRNLSSDNYGHRNHGRHVIEDYISPNFNIAF